MLGVCLKVHFLSGGHKHVPSVEDDSFVAAFDKMMTETIQVIQMEGWK